MIVISLIVYKFLPLKRTNSPYAQGNVADIYLLLFFLAPFAIAVIFPNSSLKSQTSLSVSLNSCVFITIALVFKIDRTSSPTYIQALSKYLKYLSILSLP
jgi:hypothetical protein